MTSALSRFVHVLDEATRIGLAGAAAGTLFGLFALAFVLGALWALRGRPALQPPACRRCAALLRIHDESGAARLPEACPECGERCDRIGAVRWFRFRRQATTLGITFPVVLLGGLILSGVATTVAMRILIDSVRPIHDGGRAVAEASMPTSALAMEELEPFEDLIARADAVAVARRLARIESDIRSNRPAESAPSELRELRQRLMSGDPDPHAADQRSSELRLATLGAVDRLLSRIGELAVDDLERSAAMRFGAYVLTGPRRVDAGRRMRLRLGPTPRGITDVGPLDEITLSVQVNGSPALWEDPGGGDGEFLVNAPDELGEHELSVRFGLVAIDDANRRTIRFEVVEGQPTLDRIDDDALDIAPELLMPWRLDGPDSSRLFVVLQTAGRRRLLSVDGRTGTTAPLLHGELVFELRDELGGETLVVDAGAIGRARRLGAIFERVPAAPRTIRMVYRPASADDRPPHPGGSGDPIAHPGWWGRPFGIELTAEATGVFERTRYAETRLLTAAEIAEVLASAESTRRDESRPGG